MIWHELKCVCNLSQQQLGVLTHASRRPAEYCIVMALYGRPTNETSVNKARTAWLDAGSLRLLLLLLLHGEELLEELVAVGEGRLVSRQTSHHHQACQCSACSNQADVRHGNTPSLPGC